MKITNIYSALLDLSINIHYIKLTVVTALELERLPTDVPGEVFLACQQLLQKQDAGGLEEVWLSQGMQTLLNHLQDLAHTQSLGFVQGQCLQNATGKRSRLLNPVWHKLQKCKIEDWRSVTLLL